MDLIILGCLSVWALAVGWAWLRLAGWDRGRLGTDVSFIDGCALALPLGLGTLAMTALALGLVGALTTFAIAGAVIGQSAVAAAMLRPNRGWLAQAGERIRLRPRLESWPDRALAGFAVAAVCGTLLASLAPVTDGDALCYHLQVPKVFLDRHALVYEPDLHETVYPLMTELLYACGLAIRGPIVCRLMSWLLGISLAISVTALARPALGDRAWRAGAIVLLVPAISNGMSAPLNDVALAAFGNAAILAWVRSLTMPGAVPAALAGALMGLAMGVKYPALPLFGLLILGFVGANREPGRWRWRLRWRDLLIFAMVAVAVASPWYLRAWLATGNPVHPFFKSWFGSGLDEVLEPSWRPLEPTPWNLAFALVPMTLDPGRFDTFSHQFGPMFLLFLPALIGEKPPRRIVGLAVLGLAFLMVCMTQRQSMRFLLIAMGPLSAAVAWQVSRWGDRRSRPAYGLMMIFLACAGFEASLALARAKNGWIVVSGRESSAQYLSKREPTFVVGAWISAHLPADARIIGQDHRGFYLPRPYAMELAHRRRTGLGQRGESAQKIVETLRSQGFTHLLMCPPIPETAVEFDPTLGRLLAPWLRTRSPLYKADLTDGDGVVRQYAVYALDRLGGLR